MKKNLMALVLCSFSIANQLEISVSLSPAGTFVARSEQVKVEGELQLSPQGFTARNISVSIASLKTGIELRDEHMKNKYFEVGQFPKANLIEGKGTGGKFQGKLQVHGAVRPISGTYQISGKSLEAQFKCKLSEFSIKEAKYMGVGVDDEVTVSVKLQAQ